MLLTASGYRYAATLIGEAPNSPDQKDAAETVRLRRLVEAKGAG